MTSCTIVHSEKRASRVVHANHFFLPVARLSAKQIGVQRGEKSKPLTLVFLHVSQQAGGQSAALGLATASPSPTLDSSATTMYNEGVGDILQAT